MRRRITLGTLLILSLVRIPALADQPSCDVCLTKRSCAYDRIQEAIRHAGQGDVIEVCPGTYRENVDFLGKAITVRSTRAPTAPPSAVPAHPAAPSPS